MAQSVASQYAYPLTSPGPTPSAGATSMMSAPDPCLTTIAGSDSDVAPPQLPGSGSSQSPPSASAPVGGFEQQDPEICCAFCGVRMQLTGGPKMGKNLAPRRSCMRRGGRGSHQRWGSYVQPAKNPRPPGRSEPPSSFHLYPGRERLSAGVVTSLLSEMLGLQETTGATFGYGWLIRESVVNHRNRMLKTMQWRVVSSPPPLLPPPPPTPPPPSLALVRRPPSLSPLRSYAGAPHSYAVAVAATASSPAAPSIPFPTVPAC
ncbi:hypothetical protein BDK51DRAFT_43779 [Blyttiomyces helicus]|uniref:Uncharacterized protein n=1 Tax=Blyttiomyces helicus TaxID=388810 RepID=A0A4P9WR88_9FUNG|nr:hypothetical protein BDK51DRAFT_43779 [Blyttiomyces helicus]|eukprot:RKO94723.1 hypothetical protein BDK51DRAFT_43779 [Blyttiomyces helicus]